MKVTLYFVLLTIASSRGTVAQSQSVSSQVLTLFKQHIDSLLSMAQKQYQPAIPTLDGVSVYWAGCTPTSLSGTTLTADDINKINQLCMAANKTSMALYYSTAATVTTMNQAYLDSIRKTLNAVFAAVDPLVKILDGYTQSVPQQLLSNVTNAMRFVLKSAAADTTQLCLRSNSALRTIINNGVGEFYQQLEMISFESILLDDISAGDSLRRTILQVASILGPNLASVSCQIQESAMCFSYEEALAAEYSQIMSNINNSMTVQN